MSAFGERSRVRSLWIAAALLAAAAGCGDGRPECLPVSGKVLIDGKSLTRGFVRIVPTSARPATSPIDAEGRVCFTTFEDDDGVVPGTHGVEVIAADQINPSTLRWLVPQKYRQASTSGLKVTIDRPTDSLVINLTWGGEKQVVERVDTSGDSTGDEDD